MQEWLPVVADLRAKRPELMRAPLRERLLRGDFDDVRVVIESLAEEFDVVDVAAAAVKLAHAAIYHNREIGIPEAPRAERPILRGGPRRASRTSRARRGGGDSATLCVGVGREAGIRPTDLVGAIPGQAGISSRELGAIEIADRFSLVDVPQDRADEIVAALKNAMPRGQKSACAAIANVSESARRRNRPPIAGQVTT